MEQVEKACCEACALVRFLLAQDAGKQKILTSRSSGLYAENAWTAGYSGPPPTCRLSYSISNIITHWLPYRPKF
jgi:hypothetical protein